MTSVTMLKTCPSYDSPTTPDGSVYKEKVDLIWHPEWQPGRPKAAEESLEWLLPRAQCSAKARKEVFNIAQNRHDPKIFGRTLRFLMAMFKDDPITVKLVTDVVFKNGQGAEATDKERVEAMKWLCENRPGEANTKHTIEHHLQHAPAGDPVKKYLQEDGCSYKIKAKKKERTYWDGPSNHHGFPPVPNYNIPSFVPSGPLPR